MNGPTNEPHHSTFKKKLVEAPILRFPNWLIKFHVLDLDRIHALPLYSCINAICISRIDWVSYLFYAYTIPWIYKYPDCMISRYLDPITSDSSILVSLFVWVLIGVEILSFKCFFGLFRFYRVESEFFALIPIDLQVLLRDYHDGFHSHLDFQIYW